MNEKQRDYLERLDKWLSMDRISLVDRADVTDSKVALVTSSLLLIDYAMHFGGPSPSIQAKLMGTFMMGLECGAAIGAPPVGERVE